MRCAAFIAAGLLLVAGTAALTHAEEIQAARMDGRGSFETVAASAAPPTKTEVNKLLQAMHEIGAIEGIVIACSRSPHIDDEMALRWQGWAIDLNEIAMEYAERVYADDEAGQGGALLAFGIASGNQQEEPQRLWNDPEGCGEKMRREIEWYIESWKSPARTR